ncbi:MAG: hypothetical protein Ct9H300mP28_28760 [Pseudomonadota bacterium]|nr:MAG: hypothetical protein Ct9H300mP28_28760 [Pseudomonadota bacterium]
MQRCRHLYGNVAGKQFTCTFTQVYTGVDTNCKKYLGDESDHLEIAKIIEDWSGETMNEF